MALENSASPSSCILIDLFKRKPPESCLKDVAKLSKTNKKNLVGWPRLNVLDFNATLLHKIMVCPG